MRELRLAGRTITAPHSSVSNRDSLAWLIRRGVIPVIRGTVRARLLGTASWPLALGKGVRILNGANLHVGRAVVIGDYAWLSCLSVSGVHLDDRVTIREYAWIQCTSDLVHPGDGLRVGMDTYIGPRCYIGVGGAVSIGAKCDIGGNVSIIGENHEVPDRRHSMRGAGVTRKGVTIGDDCWIGNSVSVLDGVTIGRGSVVAAGAVVTKSIPEFSVAVGVPARVVRSR